MSMETLWLPLFVAAGIPSISTLMRDVALPGVDHGSFTLRTPPHARLRSADAGHLPKQLPAIS